ncbi:MAG: YebC/PmpR family DNA-binding transcriptional regulator [Fimbriimonadaceae bacterium]|nr:YebC/PmpR family DNA-binding transcriptional regulator [Fimbriimonadaceae bacterium]
MAGHSKWKNIRIRKGKQDAIRGNLFTKLAREIIVAAKMGGGDPNTNLRLRLAIDKAKENSLPKDNIERAIAKGSGNSDGDNYEELTYEGVGPGGVAFMVEVYSDNRNRTVSELRHAFNKAGGSLTENGSVAWQFRQCGIIEVPRDVADEDTVTMAALEGGADDVKTDDEDVYVIETPVENLHKCAQALKEAGLEVKECQLTRLATNHATPDDADVPKVIRLMDALEDLDDVRQTYINFDITEEMMAEA